MCGRFSNEATMNEIRLRWEIDLVDLFREWTPKFNIAPSHGPGYEQPIVVLSSAGAKTLKLARWWLIPKAWPKPLKELPTAFNARAEDLAVKPFWKQPFRSTRCLVPATGWREFTGPKGQKQPWHFKPDGGPFVFAGLWSTWMSDQGAVDSFAIVTTVPSEAAAKVHNRMPLVLPTEHHAAWLDANAAPEPVLVAAQAAALSLRFDLYATNPVGNSVHVEDSRVVDRAG